MIWGFRGGEWRVKDNFGDEWRIFFPPISERRSDGNRGDWRGRYQIEQLLFDGFTHRGAVDDRIASVILEVYDALTNGTLAKRLPKPTRDPQRILRGMEQELRLELVAAFREDAIRIEPIPRAPWPFPDVPDEPIEPHLDVPRADVVHFIELQVLTTRGADATGVGCRIALADGTIKRGFTGPDGVLRIDGLDKAGRTTVVLPDIVPFSPDEARQAPSNGGARRITQDGIRAPIDARTIIEIPPQVYRGRLIGMFFDKNKAFLLPGAMPGIRGLTSYFEHHPGAQLLVVGHTDATGDASYNLTLSVERAKAAAAYLKDDIDAWVEWFGDDKPQAKRWGILEVQRMLSVLPDGEDAKFYTVSPPTGRKDASTHEAVKSFQQWSNQTKGTSLDVDGDPGPATQPEIVRAYMAIEGTSVSDSTVLKTHGCGEFHPQDPTPDGVADPENRRVEIFVFDDVIDPQPQECRSPGCSQYKRWIDKLVETVDFNTEDLPDTPLVVGRLPTLYSIGRSFPKPSALPMLKEVVKRMTADAQMHVLVMGHTDAIGDGDDAKEGAISKARADAIVSLLTGDRERFMKKFSAKGDDAWGWEEVQWMLSAVQADGDPCYVGAVDGHRGDGVLDAVESFQVASGLKINRHVDKETLKKLVDEYFKLVTDTKTEIHEDRIAVVAGGSWHPPCSFGDKSEPLEGDEYTKNNFLSFRRVEVFLSRVLLVPPTDTCSPSRHETCNAYEKWCKDSKEVLPDDGLHDFAIRVGDSLTGPIEGCSVSLTKGADDAAGASGGASDGPADVAAGSGSTSATGTVHFRLASGLYSATFSAGGYSKSADFLLDQDQVGGLLIRLVETLPETKPPADATSGHTTTDTSTDAAGASSAS
ncbi:MAG: OmpA family protein [Candidatus Lutacidiplasmatales archaeon]